MGEAKRRGPREPRERADRLPDFVFGRDRTAEEVEGFILAGRLVTPFSRREKPSESESAEVAKIIQALMQEVKRDPHLAQVGIWRDPANRPPDGLKPPFPDAAMIARMERCAVVVVRIDPRNDGLMRIDDTLMADILGRQ